MRLVILYGGQSAEHDVSCVSALNVMNALDRTRYDVIPVGITTDGRWINATSASEGAEAKALPSPDRLTGPGMDPFKLVGDHTTVVMPILHGPMGEDGTVQGLLEMAGVPYTGCGVLASALCMDKGAAKAAAAAAGIPQARYMSLRSNEVDDLTTKQVEAELGWPVFVKPANLGSSIGITQAHDSEDFRSALATAMRFDEYVVVEESVVAREIEVGVLGDADLRVSVAGEIRPTHGFYDYEDKYASGTAGLVIPADLPHDVATRLPGLAIEACRALRVEGMARVDFLYEENGRGLLLNEINTIPGFTPISMYPQLWAASGLDYRSLIDELVRLALVRHQRRAGFATAP